MKKLLIIAAILLTACTVVNAENKTRIGSEYTIDYGLTIGYLTGDAAFYGMAILDINAAQSNLRTRINLGLAERFFAGGKGLSPNAAVDLQYLLPITDGFYFYPSVGVYGEHFSKKSKHKVNNNFGVEAGLGLEFQFAPEIGVFVEGNYQRMFTRTEVPNRLGGRHGVVFAF